MALDFPTIRLSRLALREGNSKKPVYTMHKWWARRLGTVFRMLLLAEGRRTAHADESSLWNDFYSPTTLPKGFTVLDPFLGGGTSLVEAAKLGANCIGVDIDPVACFITRLELEDVDPDAIHKGFQSIEKSVAASIRPLYRSKVGGRVVDVIYNFWVDVVTCDHCGEQHDAHPTFQLAHDEGREEQTVICPSCGEIKTTALSSSYCRCSCGERIRLSQPPMRHGRFHCPHCATHTELHQLSRKGLVRPRLFAIEYVAAQGVRDFAPTTQSDIDLYARATQLLRKRRSELSIPDAAIPNKGRVDRRPLLYGYKKYAAMFNDRQLFCLGLIASAIRKVEVQEVRHALALAFSHCLATNNMFCAYAFGYRRLTPLFGMHSYRKVTRPVEGNVWGLDMGRGSFRNAVAAVVAGKRYMRNPYEYRYGKRKAPKRVPVGRAPERAQEGHGTGNTVLILNEDSADLPQISDASVDLILTDPPYFDNLPYSELADFYHVWLRELLGKEYVGWKQRHTPLTRTLFAGRRSGSTSVNSVETYEECLTRILSECHRVGKPNSRLVFTFHHRSTEAWGCLGRGLLVSGFRVQRVFPVRSEGQSGFHSFEGSIKWDSVFVCRRRTAPISRHCRASTVAKLATEARESARRRQRQIRRSRLAFSDADERSLACSLLLLSFSRKRILPSQLAEGLKLLSVDNP